MNEFSKINIIVFTEIENSKKSFSNDTWKICICKQSNFIDSFVFVVWLSNQIFKNVLEVRNYNIFFKLFILKNSFVYKLNSVSILSSSFHFLFFSFFVLSLRLAIPFNTPRSFSPSLLFLFSPVNHTDGQWDGRTCHARPTIGEGEEWGWEGEKGGMNASY